MNTARKLGPHAQTDRGTCPGVGLSVYFKRRSSARGGDRGAQAIVRGGARFVRRKYFIVAPRLHTRSAARCALQVLDRGAQANARGATHALDGGVQAAARCALHVHGRGARTDACGRSIAVLSTQVCACGS